MTRAAVNKRQANRAVPLTHPAVNPKLRLVASNSNPYLPSSLGSTWPPGATTLPVPNPVFIKITRPLIYSSLKPSW